MGKKLIPPRGSTQLCLRWRRICGSLFSEKLSADLTEKITMRILNKEGAAKPADLSAAEIRKLRERANMSQGGVRALPQRNHWLRLAARARRQATHRRCAP